MLTAYVVYVPSVQLCGLLPTRQWCSVGDYCGQRTVSMDDELGQLIPSCNVGFKSPTKVVVVGVSEDVTRWLR